MLDMHGDTRCPYNQLSQTLDSLDWLASVPEVEAGNDGFMKRVPTRGSVTSKEWQVMVGTLERF